MGSPEAAACIKLTVVRVRFMVEWKKRLHECQGRHTLVKRKQAIKIAEWQRAGGRRKEVKSQDGIHTI